MAHRHIDLTAATRAAFRSKLRKQRRAADRRRALASRHHGAESAPLGR